MFVYYLWAGLFTLREQNRLTAHTHTRTPVGGFVPNRGNTLHNNPQLYRHIHVQQQQYAVGQDIYGLPGVAFAKKSLMQHTACQSARWGHGGYVFRWSNLCWSSCEKASAIHVWAGNQRKQPAERKLMRWSLLMPPCRSAQWHMAASQQHLTWVI